VNSLDEIKTPDELKTWRNIYVYPPAQVAFAPNLSKNLTSYVETGLKNNVPTECRSQVIFNKNQFVPGEKAMVRIICDNTSCAVDVLGFKVKLVRHVGLESNTVSAVREVGECIAGQKTDRTFVLDIPLENELDDLGKTLASQTADDHMAMKPLTCSVFGQLVKVKYSLQVSVRHETRGRGNRAMCLMPIQISRDFS